MFDVESVYLPVRCKDVVDEYVDVVSVLDDNLDSHPRDLLCFAAR